MKKRRIFFCVVTALVIAEVTSVYFMFQSLNNKQIVLDDVKLKDIANKNNSFAIMLNEGDGNYVESSSNEWPDNTVYAFNSSKSGCIDNDGASIDNAISYNNSTRQATLSIGGTAYCYLYFDKDTTAPTNGSVKINNNATYTTSTGVTLTLSATDATQMCISNTNSCTNYITYATSYSHTLTTGDGTKTVYVWFKDNAGNTTSAVTDTITLDTTKPTVTASVNNNNTDSPTITITSNEAGTYCVNTNATTASSCTKTGSISANSSVTTSALTSDGTYYAHVTDSAGNIGNSTAVSITIKTTTYLCTTGTAAGTCINSAKTTGYNSTAYNGMYRYIGTSANNYVSLSGVLYRIIGVTSAANSTLGLSANQLKLIKAASIGTYNWHSSYTTDTIWTSSAMYTYLQGSNVLSNTSIIPSGWSSKISSVKWNIGDVNTTTIPDASTVLGLEDNTVTSGTSKIGLMYMSDYYYAQTAGGTTNCYSACSNWMTLGSYEWTMTRYGLYGSSYLAWSVGSGGAVDWRYLTNAFAVRPVFYLASSVTYVSGAGTSDDPIILS